jgi:hypothetical protein
MTDEFRRTNYVWKHHFQSNIIMSLEDRPAIDLPAARVLAAATVATAYWEGFISCLCLRDVQYGLDLSSIVSIKRRVTVVVVAVVVAVAVAVAVAVLIVVMVFLTLV